MYLGNATPAKDAPERVSQKALPNYNLSLTAVSPETMMGLTGPRVGWLNPIKPNSRFEACSFARS